MRPQKPLFAVLASASTEAAPSLGAKIVSSLAVLELPSKLLFRPVPGPAQVSDLQGRRDSNPQPTVLETVALPIAPLPFQPNG